MRPTNENGGLKMSEKKNSENPFRVGTPPARPGENPIFNKWSFQPEDLKKLDPLKCTTKDSEPHAIGLLRVLNDNFEAKGEWNPELDADTLRMGLEHMMRLSLIHI